ncbi:MAG TPA: M4 family metallopeptidase [Mycobacteriales bacterium]|nr:M4 family metallopeptidase [Mycobacteriales bacterium]
MSLTAAMAAAAVAAPAGAAPVPGPAAPAVQPATAQPEVAGARTLAATPGHPLRRPAGLTSAATPEEAARAALREYAATLRLAGGDRSLRVERTVATAGGGHVVRFAQSVGDVPVLGAGVTVTLGRDGRALGVVAKLSEAVPRARPTVAADRAVRAARSVGVPSGPAVRWLYDAAALGAPGRPGAVPVWRVPVTPASGGAADVLVDARTGRIVLATDGVRGAAAPQRVCDLANTNVSLDADAPGYRCLSGGATVVAAPSGSAVTDVKQAYDYAAETASFYDTLFGRRSIDGAGGTIVSSARVCKTPGDAEPEPEPCYHADAFWDGAQMVYAPGYTVAKDLVAHELTHGVTQYTSNLYYAYQSGAINESMSDVFGELVQRAATPADLSGPWLLGESLPTGALRDLGTPGDYAQPASMTDPLYAGPEYDAAGQLVDRGGVHTNSGVGNRAAYLVAQSLGIAKTAHLYYGTLLALPSGANYADLAATLSATCDSLVGQARPALPGGTVTMTTGDCAAVGTAIDAVQMTTPPTAPNAVPAEAADCPTGMTRGETVLSDGFEGPSRWTLATAAPVGTGRNAGFSVYTPSNPPQRDESWAHTGRSALIGQTADGADATARTATARLTAPVAIPAGTRTFLRFAHVKQLDTDVSNDDHYDGGTVSVVPASGSAVDLGAPARPHSAQGYDGPLLGGPAAVFSGYSAGYGSSRFDLTEFAGTSISPQFTVTGDPDISTFWLLDDVEIYTCSDPLPDQPRSVAATGVEPGTVRLTWTAPQWAGDGGLTRYEVSSTPALAGQPLAVAATGTSVAVSGLDPATAYTFHVTAVAAGGTAAGAPPAVTLTPSAVTVARSVTFVAYPAALTLSGTVTRPDTRAVVPSAAVTLQGRVAGTTAWTTIGTGRTTSAGRYAFSHRPRERHEYRVLGGGAGIGASASAVTGVTVAPSVAASFRSTAVRRGNGTVLRVATAPVRAYAVVELQRRSGHRWVTVSRSRTTSTGKVAFAVRPGARGTFVYRALVASGPAHRVAASAARALRVS